MLAVAPIVLAHPVNWLIKQRPRARARPRLVRSMTLARLRSPAATPWASSSSAAIAYLATTQVHNRPARHAIQALAVGAPCRSASAASTPARTGHRMCSAPPLRRVLHWPAGRAAPRAEPAHGSVPGPASRERHTNATSLNTSARIP
jgi:hypothetical protein